MSWRIRNHRQQDTTSTTSSARSSPWKTTRRLQLWMKHSLSSLSSHQNEPVFDADENDVPHQQQQPTVSQETSFHSHSTAGQTRVRRRPSSTRILDATACDAADAAHQEGSIAWEDDHDNDASFLEREPSTSTSPFPVVPSCPNIDAALAALYSGCDMPTAPFVSQPEHDWLLDGMPEWLLDIHESQRLVEELTSTPPPLEELLLQQNDCETQKNVVVVETTTKDEDEEDFGEFQSADATTVQEQSGANHESISEHASTSQASSFPASREESQENTTTTVHDQDAKHDFVSNIVPLERPHSSVESSSRTTFPPSIYREMPLECVSSPEGRFVRRQQQQQQQQQDSVVSEADNVVANDDDDDDDDDDRNVKEGQDSTLSDAAIDYYAKCQDVTLRVLKSLPWQRVPLLHGGAGDMESLEEYLLRQLSRADALYEEVQMQLLRRVGQKTDLLNEANRQVRDLDHNLSMAHMYATRTKEFITAVLRGREEDGTGVRGQEVLLQDFDNRDQYRQLRAVLDKVARFLETEQVLRDKIDRFGVVDGNHHQEILSIAAQLQADAAHDGDLSEMDGLSELRERVGNVLETFRLRIEAVLRTYVSRVCHSWQSFSESEYESLVRATLEIHQQTYVNTAPSTGSDDTASLTIAERWSNCITDTLCFQIEKCFARALLDPTDAGDSEYDKDLVYLGLELSGCSSDRAKLLSLTHNLVTIRFDFESDQNYLLTVYHRLCVLLTDVLHSHNVFIRWHSTCDGEFQVGILDRLLEAKTMMWRQCEEVLTKCLDRYLHSGGKKILFGLDECNDGRLWLEDLAIMHDLFKLTQQFLSLGTEFLNPDQLKQTKFDCLTSNGLDGELCTKLCDVFRKHLRCVHVEAMNSMGSALRNESWRLIGLGSCYVENISVNNKVVAVKERVLGAIVAQSSVLSKHGQSISNSKPYWQNAFELSTNGLRSCLANFEQEGNPFLRMIHSDANILQHSGSADLDISLGHPPKESSSLSSLSSNGDVLCSAGNGSTSSLYSIILSLCEADGDVVPYIATEAIVGCLMKWVARLLSISIKLPVIAKDAGTVITNLCDLYYTTAFRLCAGSRTCERIILGMEFPTPSQPEVSEPHLQLSPRAATHRKQPSGSRRLGFGRRPSHSKQARRRSLPVGLPTNLEAVICAPRLCELKEVLPLQSFIQRGQESLEGIVNLQRIENWFSDHTVIASDLDKDTLLKLTTTLEKREGASWSCLLVAVVLDVALDFVKKNLKVADIHHDIDSFASYVRDAIRTTSLLVTFSSRISSSRAIMAKQIVEEVIAVGTRWEEPVLNENCNQYIDELCDRVAIMWELLSTSRCSLPSPILKTVFEHIIETAYLSLLEGFSRIHFCSTEGRSLMSMDLSAFSMGVEAKSILERLDNSIVAPPVIHAARDANYVDTYIKVFYYPEEDVKKWIAANYSNYLMNHSLALLTTTNNDRINDENREVDKAASFVKNLYSATVHNGILDSER